MFCPKTGAVCALCMRPVKIIRHGAQRYGVHTTQPNPADKHTSVPVAVECRHPAGHPGPCSWAG